MISMCHISSNARVRPRDSPFDAQLKKLEVKTQGKF